MAFQRDIKFWNVFVFMETWLDPSIPDSSIIPEGVSIHRQDRTTNSGKSKGGGVCFMVNNLLCSDVEIISSGCSPDLEHLMIRCRPYYIPSEFTSVVITAVYIRPHAHTNQALDELHAMIDRTERSRPEAAFIVAGDFNNAKMRKVLPRYYQHISCPTRCVNTLDHVYTPLCGAYKALPRPPFCKSDHVSVLLLPSYRQKLKRDRPVTRTIQWWSDQSDSALQDCFSMTEWCVFQDDDINTYTDAVICYISKCIDDVVPRISVQTFPNQKPWINGDVHAKLKAGTVAYISGDLEEYSKSRYVLRSAISSAKRLYRDKVESHYKGSNTRNMWAGLRTITDYKAKTSSADVVSASLPEDLNTFYARFESSPPAVEIEQAQEDRCPPSYPGQTCGDLLTGSTHARHLDLMASLAELSRCVQISWQMCSQTSSTCHCSSL
ncbi:uncharacterized protein LOC128450974 isoform X2 [Pleuronectes platessa]|uniref:uncharacterized protein LOC128450974 isoform X2 n=1 Tax=Pleuronectes platessa TaxID=8262 RepID=UPI00232A5C20|nr:uncharacterized protein LOC128450974 isoform X2 [Pleuronectes platessa]